jgi:hypothetical protein
VASSIPEERTQISRKAAHTRWAKASAAGRQANAQRGQQGLRGSFERKIREDIPGLSDSEYAVMAQNAYMAHMAGVALASSRARKARASGAA